MVFLKLLLVGLCFFALPQGIQAKEKAKLLGYGLLFTNDFFGDGSDRWRSGSLMSSRVFDSPKMSRTLPRREALNELRLFSQIIAPSDLSRNPDRSYARDETGLTEDIDRDYVGHLSKFKQGSKTSSELEWTQDFLVICPKHSLQERPFQGSVIAL